MLNDNEQRKNQAGRMGIWRSHDNPKRSREKSDQYITTEEYLLLAQIIQTQPEQIRVLCLLALPVL